MEMLQLRYFYESALSESFSRTAKKYMVPVSSVSASVKRLEQELGTALFERTGNRVILNEKGRQFLAVVSNTLSQLDMGVSALSADPVPKQTLSLLVRCNRQRAVRETIQFQKLYPSISFKFTFDDAPENFDQYDVVISTPHEALAEYEYFPWQEYTIRIEALESDPLCRRPVTLNQLKDRLFVTTSVHRGSFQVLEKACKKAGFTPKLFVECDDYTCRDMVVTSGAALGLTFGKNNSGLPNVQYLNVTDFNERVVSGIYYRKEAYNGNQKLFIDLIKQSIM